MKVKIVIGDLTGDGHNEKEPFFFEVNKTIEEIRQAYKDSCLLTGIEFNGHENYTGITRENRRAYQVCVQFEDNQLSTECSEILNKFGLDYSDYVGTLTITCEVFVELLIDFIKLSLPDLTIEEASVKRSEVPAIPCIQGDNFNHFFGYGIFLL